MTLFHRISIILIALVTVSCNDGDGFRSRNVSDDNIRAARVDSLLSLMTLEEKLGQLNLPSAGDISTGLAQSTGIIAKVKQGRVGGLFNIRGLDRIRATQKVAVEESRLGIPLLFGMDVIHGYRTGLPIPLGIASSFNMELVEETARMAANEATADGIAWTFSPMVDIARDPRWGRIAEGAGEDAYLGSRVAEAMVRGYQGEDLTLPNTMMSCVKHFALYGASEAGRDYATTDMSRLRMYNEYLPPYNAAVDAGVGSVMSAFNDVDGVPAAGNRWLLTELLREQWGFTGFVVSDYTGVTEMVAHGVGDTLAVAAMALKAGNDMDMVSEAMLNKLPEALDKGMVSMDAVDQACRRVLDAKFKLGLFDDPYRYIDENRSQSEIYTDENRAKARELTAETLVLLKNENGTLPLKKEGTVALIGPMADNSLQMAGTWSVAVDQKASVTLRQALTEVGGENVNVITARGSNFVEDPGLEQRIGAFGKNTYRDNRSERQMIAEALGVARRSDVIVAAVGEAAESSGESSSLTNIDLPANQVRLLQALSKTGKPLVLVLFAGRPLAFKWAKENVPAILNVWFPGTDGAYAIADVLFGDANPSGKLPVTFPQNTGQIPIYYNYKNTGRPLAEGNWFQKFKSNYLDVPNEPLYPFGYGLSYAEFEYGEINLSSTDLGSGDSLTASISVRNSGEVPGKEVVQLYIRDVVGSITRPVKELKGFKKVEINPGETKTVSFTITTDDLMFYNYDLDYVWEPGEFEVMIGTSSDDVQSQTVNWSK